MLTNRVKGATLKAAAIVHAKKQLGALGVPFIVNRGSATFTGKTAFATWDTNGGLVTSFRINYPALPDNALIGRCEADLISAYTLHELGHIAFTDNSVVRHVKPAVFQLWNGIEDARIERAIIASGNARGARSAFKRLMSKFTVTADSEGFNPASINGAPFALALICRAALGDGNGYAKTLLDRIPAAKRALYAEVAEGVKLLPLDRTGSAAALELAKAFLDKWVALEPVAAPAETAEQQENREQQQSMPSGEEVEQPEDSQQLLGNMFGDDADDADGDDGEDGEDGEDDAMQSAIAEELANAQAAPEADDSSFAQSGADDEEDDAGDVTGSAPGFGDVSEQFNEEEAFKAEPNIDDLFDQIMKRTKAPITLPPANPARRTVMRAWRTIDFDEVAAKRAAKKLHKAALPAMKAQLYRMLKAPERCGWDSGALGGRFDGKRSARMMAGSEAVFKRRWNAEGINTAVSVVVDMSGSMKGDAIKQSVDLAWTIAEACEAAGAEVEVTGFNTSYYEYQSGGYDLNGNYVSADISGTDPATLVVAKRFQDKLATCAQYFNVMKRAATGGTPDYSAIRSVCEQLSTFPAQRKLVIVITDGLGDAHAVKMLTEVSYDMYGIDVVGFGIGIGKQSFSRAYAVGDVVNASWSEDGTYGFFDLHKTVLKSVANQLERRDVRRAA